MSTEIAPPKRFRYVLQPLLRKRSAELDRARESLAAATLQLAARARELEAHSAGVGQLQSYQRELSQGGLAIDVEARLRLYDCIRAAVTQREERAVQVDRARQHHDGVVDQVRQARQALKALERHREHSEQKHNADQLHRAHNASDELHLSSGQSVGRMMAVGR